MGARCDTKGFLQITTNWITIDENASTAVSLSAANSCLGQIWIMDLDLGNLGLSEPMQKKQWFLIPVVVV